MADTQERICVGVMGSGDIAPQYLKNMLASPFLKVKSISARHFENAQKMAAEYGLEPTTNEEMLADPEIQVVLDLAPNMAHYELSMANIEAGKHIYSEKPLAPNLDQALEILEAANAKGLMVACAPDNILSPSLRAAKKLIDDDAIGRVMGIFAFMSHDLLRQMRKPIPFFYFQEGAGTRDLEPYPITPVVQLLGPAVRVCSSTPYLMRERDILFPGEGVKKAASEVPMHSSAIIDFANGTLATVIVTDDLWTSGLPGFEIYGEKGTISLYDQHKFMSRVRICNKATGEWDEVPVPQDVPNGRGLGVENMARALLFGEELVPSGALACHVVEIMDAIAESSKTGQHVTIHRTNGLLG